MSDATQAGQLVIPDDLKARYPELLELIVRSESMNNEERQYWVNILPIMTPDQVQNLRDILLNERRQLAAIDQKYAKEIEQIGQAQVIKKAAEERRHKRQERAAAEAADHEDELGTEEDLLKQIEGM